jgi:hypothetical protein
MRRSTNLGAADRIFLAAALLHREDPERSDFTIDEIVARAEEDGDGGRLADLAAYATLHCVANFPPNPENHRMLFATSPDRRRLVEPGDIVHPGRIGGKIWPDLDDVPASYHELIRWAKQRYGGGREPSMWLEGVLQLRGMGRKLWEGEDPDSYVRKLREGW